MAWSVGGHGCLPRPTGQHAASDQLDGSESGGCDSCRGIHSDVGMVRAGGGCDVGGKRRLARFRRYEDAVPCEGGGEPSQHRNKRPARIRPQAIRRDGCGGDRARHGDRLERRFAHRSGHPRAEKNGGLTLDARGPNFSRRNDVAYLAYRYSAGHRDRRNVDDPILRSARDLQSQ